MDAGRRQLDPAFNAQIRRLIDERDAFCPRCKYNLSGLRSPRCPECGRNVRDILRIADTTPWRLPHIRRRMLAAFIARRVALATVIAGSVASIVWATWVLVGRGR